MTVLDIVLIVVLGFGLIRGFFNGLFVEIASLVALIAGVYGAVHFSDYAATLLQNHVDWDEKTINIAAFTMTFIAIVLVISLLGKALTKIANFASLGIVNKFLGATFGFLKWAMISSIILVIFDSANKTIPFVSQETIDNSALYEPVKSLSPMIMPSLLQLKQELTDNGVQEDEGTENI